MHQHFKFLNRHITMRTPVKSLFLVTCLAVFSIPASAGFFGPSNNLLSGDALMQKLQSQPLVVDVGGSALDVRSKSAAIGGFLLGFIASSAMASGGGMPSRTNPQQLNQSMQANMQIATEFNKNFQTAFTSLAASQAAKLSGQVGKEGPVVMVAQQLATSLAQSPNIKAAFLAPNEKPKPTDLQLRITQLEWLLDFSMTSSDYTLSHRMEVSVYQKETDTIFFKQDCQGTAESKKPKEDWEKDDFAAVASAALDVGNKCALKVIAALGLQPGKELIPLTPDLAPGPSATPALADKTAATDTTPGDTAKERQEIPPPAVEAQK
jgi:hypothetical protein